MIDRACCAALFVCSLKVSIGDGPSLAVEWHLFSGQRELLDLAERGHALVDGEVAVSVLDEAFRDQSASCVAQSKTSAWVEAFDACCVWDEGDPEAVALLFEMGGFLVPGAFAPGANQKSVVVGDDGEARPVDGDGEYRWASGAAVVTLFRDERQLWPQHLERMLRRLEIYMPGCATHACSVPLMLARADDATWVAEHARLRGAFKEMVFPSGLYEATRTRRQARRSPLLHLYLPVFGHSVLVPQVLDFWRSRVPSASFTFVDEGARLEDGSSPYERDGTMDLAVLYDCEIIHFRARTELGPHVSVPDAYREFRNDVVELSHAASRAGQAESEWVGIPDLDELLDVDDHKLETWAAAGVGVVKATAFQMVGDSLELRGVDAGYRDFLYDKVLLVRPSRVSELNSLTGNHAAIPEPLETLRWATADLYHYKLVSPRGPAAVYDRATDDDDHQIDWFRTGCDTGANALRWRLATRDAKRLFSRPLGGLASCDDRPDWLACRPRPPFDVQAAVDAIDADCANRTRERAAREKVPTLQGGGNFYETMRWHEASPNYDAPPDSDSR